jgi:uncharacterized protein (TIGR02145 family)
MNVKQKILLLLILIFLIGTLSIQGSSAIKGPSPYLGKKPPGLKSEIFAPGIVSTKADKYAFEISPSGNTVTDIDGNVYKTVKIGSQVWMAENLKVTRYRNGDPIPNVTGASEWKRLSTGAYCNYDNNSSNASTYGRLYNWYAVNDRRNIAPAGWHVPTDEEWRQLEEYLGMSQSKENETGWRGSDEGGKLKERGTAHWKSPNNGATNSSGFSVLPGGYRYYLDSAYITMSATGHWWSAAACYSNYAWYRYLHYDYSAVARDYGNKRSGFSVRLLRD